MSISQQTAARKNYEQSMEILIDDGVIDPSLGPLPEFLCAEIVYFPAGSNGELRPREMVVLRFREEHYRRYPPRCWDELELLMETRIDFAED